jgi:T-complex protein 1 subunit theta
MSSMAYNAAAGLPGMLKEGTRHVQDDSVGSSSVVLSNIEACLQLCRMLQSSLGPQGRCKLVVNHLEKIVVTSDCAAILQQVGIEHPTAHLLAQAVHKQKEECGDQTNLVLTFAGELLWQTSQLIHKMTWQTAPEILAGYQQALNLITSEYLPAAVCETVSDQALLEKDTLLHVLKPVLQSKVYGVADVLAPLVADACLLLLKDDSSSGTKTRPKLAIEAIRTVTLLGAPVSQSKLLQGYVAKRGLDTSFTETLQQVKIAVFATGVEASSTEAKGTVVMKNAADLQAYNKSEETKMQDIIAGLQQAGIGLVVTGGNVSDMALHFMEQYHVACLRIGSKWELRRLCQAVGATALVRLGTPLPDELGYAAQVRQESLGDQTVTVLDVGSASKLATLVLRASTSTLLADLERAVDDGVQAVAQLCKDGRLVYGGGCVEMACATALLREADRVPGLAQYAYQAMGKALQIVPRVLAENAGYSAAPTVAHLQAAHAAAAAATGTSTTICDMGIDIDKEDNTTTYTGITSMKDKGVVDVLSTKLSALRFAVDAVITILKIDQIIMSKPAGGPKQG